MTITPLTFDALYLTSTLRKIFIKNVDNTARALRLSSLLFGKRQAIEEIILQGTFARVPATDNIRIRPARKMFIPCQKDGTSLTEEGRGWIEDQVFEMATTRPRDQYELIYLPKNWKWRVAGFVFLNWASTMLVALSGFVTLRKWCNH